MYEYCLFVCLYADLRSLPGKSNSFLVTLLSQSCNSFCVTFLLEKVTHVTFTLLFPLLCVIYTYTYTLSIITRVEIFVQFFVPIGAQIVDIIYSMN